MSNTGYIAMLRDRVPYVVNLALKWCQIKERWLKHVYDSQIGIYDSKNERYNATRIVLGIQKGHKPFDFHSTIDWYNLSDEDKKTWSYVEGWIKWFSSCYMYIKNAYEISISNGKSKDSAKAEIIDNYLNSLDPAWQDKLATFLINSF